MARKRTESSGTGRGVALILILLELCGAFYFGMLILESFGSETLREFKFSAIGAGLAGIFAYIILHVIPGIRWLMMAVIILLWAFVAYSLGLMMIGERQESFQWVSHKGPYIAAVIAGLFRALMYR